MQLGSAREIWRAALEELQRQVSPLNYETWLKDTVGLSYHQDQLVIGVSSTFALECLERDLRPLIRP